MVSGPSVVASFCLLVCSGAQSAFIYSASTRTCNMVSLHRARESCEIEQIFELTLCLREKANWLSYMPVTEKMVLKVLVRGDYFPRKKLMVQVDQISMEKWSGHGKRSASGKSFPVIFVIYKDPNTEDQFQDTAVLSI